MGSGFRGNLTSRPLQRLATLVQTPLVVSTTAVAIPSSWIPNGTSAAWLCCDTMGGGIKLSFGSDPTTIFGFDLGPGQTLEIRDNNDLITSAKFIRVTATDGRLSFLSFIE